MSTSRDHIIDAIVAAIAGGGIDKATVRTVAGEAGVSIGAVQHHFPTKAAMLTAAMEAISAAVTADIEAYIGTFEPAGTPAEEAGQTARMLRHLAFMLCSIRDEDLIPAGIWLDFVALSRVTPELAEIHARTWAQLRERMSQLITGAHPGHPAPEAAAGWALATFDGIAVARVTEPQFMTGTRAAALAERTLAAIAAEAAETTGTTASRAETGTD
ncbi:TetR/AcrR family transcriptional regulator [Brevibacterium gallinarum]|uniref:TetR/AcrR family transcriptional regulator n=1 Tax=Brevibacterium gallinarum TaxID=2762220 RepID=A0ABR8WWD9_9MICO|nr:TetR/AcrR family transcriptional regulator [Brevibacterium gallinarum]MBD8020931.1 TetR/AcrR family transcriptional regulator [Brevibacterium gallinarum]